MSNLQHSANSADLPVAITVIAEHYSAWVTEHGGTVRLLTPDQNPSLEGAAGLLLTGGEDVEPIRYGEPNRFARRINRERDEFELTLLRAALLQNLPVLAVCRGMQLLVVALEGTLYQDLGRELVLDRANFQAVIHRAPDHSDAVHSIDVQPGTRFTRIVKCKSLEVNSHHHQGVRTLGHTLVACAHSPDGLIEAVEDRRRSFLLGVQWHPERWADGSSVAIIESFLAACRE